MKRILITGVGGPAGNNFVRSLRCCGERSYLVGTDTNKYHLEWPQIDAAYLSPKNTNANYVNFLNKVIEKENIELIHPQPDAEVKVISDLRSRLKAKTFLPSKKTIDICQDKFLSAKEWLRNDIPCPKSVFISQEEDLTEAETILGLPFWLRATKGAGGRGSTPINELEVAKHWIKYWRLRGEDWEFVAHEYLPGKNYAFQSIWKNGELITSQARERLEYIYPYLAPSGITGTPTVAVTISNEEVNKAATDCVLAIDKKATGIFCVDLKENQKKIPCPTEINCGRFFTTSYFFTKAGINMPHLFLKLAYNEEIPNVPKYNAIPAGVYWIRHIDCPGVMKKDGEWVSKNII